MLGNLIPVPASHLPIVKSIHNNLIRIWIGGAKIASAFCLNFFLVSFTIRINMIFSKLRNENMTKIMRAMKMVMTGRSDVTGITANECDVCIPDNITIIPLYRISGCSICSADAFASISKKAGRGTRK
jgi:hypothetical protein